MAKKPRPQNIIDANDNKYAFSLSAMMRETVRDEQEDDPTYEDFINSVSGNAQPTSERAKNDLRRLKDGEYVLQPTYSPLDIASSEDVEYNINDIGDEVISETDEEQVEPR